MICPSRPGIRDRLMRHGMLHPPACPGWQGGTEGYRGAPSLAELRDGAFIDVHHRTFRPRPPTDHATRPWRSGSAGLACARPRSLVFHSHTRSDQIGTDVALTHWRRRRRAGGGVSFFPGGGGGVWGGMATGRINSRCTPGHGNRLGVELVDRCRLTRRGPPTGDIDDAHEGPC